MAITNLGKRITNINSLKAFGSMQKSFMFSVGFPYFPPFIPANDFSLLVRNTSIPAKSRDSTVIHTRFGSFTVPNGAESGHEWTCTIMLPEKGNHILRISQWFNNIDNFPLVALKVDVTVTMLNLNKEPTENIWIIEGIYPKSKFGIEGLSQDAVEGFISFDAIFAFDQIRFLGESI